MRLRIIIEVVDETRKGTRRRREIDVPDRVINVHKALCEGRRELRALVADDVMSAALKSVSGQQVDTEALSEALAGPSSGSHQQPLSGHNKLESFLGLDVIEHMDNLDSRGVQMVEQAPKTKDDTVQGMKWGALGWGVDKRR